MHSGHRSYSIWVLKSMYIFFNIYGCSNEKNDSIRVKTHFQLDWLWLNNTSLFENSADSAFSNAIYPNGDVILNFSSCHFLRKERTSNVLQTVHWLHQQRISNFSKETSTAAKVYLSLITNKNSISSQKVVVNFLLIQNSFKK